MATKRAPRVDQIMAPVRVGSRLDQREYEMLVRIADQEQRPLRTMIRVMIKRCIDQAIMAGEVEPVEGYVVPAAAVVAIVEPEPASAETDPVERYA